MTSPRPAPYPADTRAKGWRFELEYERIEQSDTWAIAEEVQMAQHALLFMWLAAWKQEPCGSFPNDEAVIRTKCRVPPKLWPTLRAVLLRGWWLADDGRLYHPTITARVLEMLEYRRKTAERVAKHKEAKRSERAGNALPTEQQQVKNDTGTGTGTIEEPKSLLPQAPAFPAENRPAEPPQLSLVEATKPRPKTVPDCPHQAVLALWAEVLPAMPQHNAGMWGGTRADHLRARWRETAVAEKWETETDGLAYMRRLFGYVGRSAFLTGRSKGGGDRPPFVAELAWIVNPQNWAKVHEGKYHTDAA